MSRSDRKSLVAVSLLVVPLTLLAGCEQYHPQPDAEALIRFVANARLNGKLRVVWPEGMDYLENVMKADAELRAKLLEAAGPVNAAVMLWPKDDPRWRDVDSLSPAPQTVSDDAPTTAPAAPFQTEYDELVAAVEALPADLAERAGTSTTALSERVQEALAVDGVPLRDYVDHMARLADLRARLHSRIGACRESFAEEATGLAFDDAECARQVSALYDELAQALAAHREGFREFAVQRMEAVDARIGEVDKQREREEYLLLDNTREYVKDTIEGWLKEHKNRIRTLEQRVKEPSDDDTSATLAYYERRIGELAEARNELKAFALELGALRSTDEDDE